MCVRCTAVVLGTLLVGMVATGRDEYEGKGTDVEQMAAIHKTNTNTKGLLPSNGRTRGCWALGGRLTF